MPRINKGELITTHKGLDFEVVGFPLFVLCPLGTEHNINAYVMSVQFFKIFNLFNFKIKTL